jgi:hypothetical protein
MAELATSPTATTLLDVERLVTMAWRGEIRVPHFQRGFRWQRRDVIRLFESIQRGYPIGSLLLWRRSAPAGTLQLGALTVDAPKNDRALWVVDGQQRITSLANALDSHGWHDDRFRIAYDLANDRFVPLPPQPVEESLVIPLPVLFNLRKVLGWFQSHPEVAEYADRANAITTSLRQYRVPAYEVEHDDERVLRDIFDRMNNYGKRLSRAEVFFALFPDDGSRRQSLTFDGIAARIDEDLEFGPIDRDTVLKAVLARRGPNVLREIRNEFGDQPRLEGARQAGRTNSEFPDEDRDTAYRLGEEALRRAVRFLQDTTGVPHITMLPYRHLLVVLTRLFAHHPELDAVNLRRLRRWYWRAAVVGPEVFRGSTTGAIRTLCYAVNRQDAGRSIEELLRLVDHPERPRPDLRRFRSNEAGSKIVLCAWWSEGPRSLYDGEPLDRSDLAEILVDRSTAADAIRYVVPRPRVPAEYRLWAADRVLLPDPDTDGYAVDGHLISPTLDLDEVRWQAVLHSHLLDEHMVSLLNAGKVVEFLTARQERLHTHLTTFLQRMCEWEFEDTPPLADLVVEDLADGGDEFA